MEGTVHIVTLDQKPCVVHYLEQYNKFIVATYELFPSIDDARLKLNSAHHDDRQLKKTLERINHRAGKLILIRGNDVTVPSIEYEFDCYEGGGIFDAKVSYNKLDFSYRIYAAHSNGTIGVYKLSLHCGNKICLKEHITVIGSKMLTTIDIFPESSTSEPLSRSPQSLTTISSLTKSSTSRMGSPTTINNRLIVGDAEGYISVISDGEIIRENVTDGDSVWQVKSLRLTSGKDIIFVGADNCSWFIYGINEVEKRLILLYKNSYKDFSAGITSISVLDTIQSNEHDLVEILLGSYDETLQSYHVTLNHDGISRPGVCHKNTLSIDEGGIWRVKQFKGTKRQLCIAAMYAGSFILSLDGTEHQSMIDLQREQNQKPELEMLIKLIDTESLKLAHKPLHYDIDVSSCNTTYCIVDFNNSLCIFKTIHPHS